MLEISLLCNPNIVDTDEENSNPDHGIHQSGKNAPSIIFDLGGEELPYCDV